MDNLSSEKRSRKIDLLGAAFMIIWGVVSIVEYLIADKNNTRGGDEV